MGKLALKRGRGKTSRGYFRPRNPHKYLGNVQHIVFRSSWELAVCRWCDDSSDVERWASEELCVPYKGLDRQPHKYYLDFVIQKKNSPILLVEVKPKSQLVVPTKIVDQRARRRALYTYGTNTLKWNAAKNYAARRGMRFEIWTEVDLKHMGIL